MRRVHWKPVGVNIIVNICLGIYLCVVIVVCFIGKGRKEVKWYGDVQRGLKRKIALL